jgi:Uma2 family endonuclease
VEKLSEYAAFGVPWYWLVDPAFRSVEIFKLGRDGYYTRVFGETKGAYPVPGCEALTLDLDALWAEIDRLDPGESSAP